MVNIYLNIFFSCQDDQSSRVRTYALTIEFEKKSDLSFFCYVHHEYGNSHYHISLDSFHLNNNHFIYVREYDNNIRPKRFYPRLYHTNSYLSSKKTAIISLSSTLYLQIRYITNISLQHTTRQPKRWTVCTLGCHNLCGQ
jgi:hypothetical protein